MTDDEKQKLIDDNRDININHGSDWWDFTYDTFREDMAAIGIRVDTMYFSGFASQGDGACFEGVVDDWTLLLPAIGYYNDLLIRTAAEFWSHKSVHSGPYHHEYSVRFDSEVFNPHVEHVMWSHDANDHDGVPLLSAAARAVLGTFDYDEIETELRDVFRDKMRDLYRRLEREYDWLTSDGVVWETLMANDMINA